MLGKVAKKLLKSVLPDLEELLKKIIAEELEKLLRKVKDELS